LGMLHSFVYLTLYDRLGLRRVSNRLQLNAHWRHLTGVRYGALPNCCYAALIRSLTGQSRSHGAAIY
jgi:hypothetical protein